MQRFRCTRCGKTFSESQPLAGVRVESDKAAQVVQMLCEGIGVRATSRLSGVDQKTVLNILNVAAEHCAQYLDERLRQLSNEPLEIDECWTLVANKRAKGNTESTGDFYAFLASGKYTKLIYSHYTGKRDYTVGQDFTADIKSRMANRFQITSDGWVGFIRGIATQARDNADYAIQVKKYEGYNISLKDTKRRYSPGKCVSVETSQICGQPDPLGICTSHAERLNLSLRHFNKRFTRLSPCFSKKLANLADSVALSVAVFNFCRPHASLRLKATGTEKAMERTPAMAAHLTDHVWTVQELLSATI